MWKERNNAEYIEIADLKYARLQNIKTLRCCGLDGKDGLIGLKNVRISEELFIALLKYHLVERDDVLSEIKKGLEEKLEAMVRRDLYTKYKTAPTEEEREKARQEYLEKVGMHRSFRW